MSEQNHPPPIVIKKYANRRLYNTSTSSYITLSDLCQMTKEGVDFVAYDVKTGENITQSLLTQIIVEEESKGHNLLPINFLRHLIGLYGNNMQALVPSYLEYSIENFIRNHNRIQEYMKKYFQTTFSGLLPFKSLGNLEEINKRNIDFFEKTMRLFNPFQVMENLNRQDTTNPQKSEENTKKIQALLEELHQRLDTLEDQILTLKKQPPPAPSKKIQNEDEESS